METRRRAIARERGRSMDNSALFGRYWSADSAIHQLDPRTKLMGTLALVVILFCATSPLSLGVVAAFTVVLFALARIPLGQALRSIAPLSFIIVFTVLFNLFFVQGGDTYADWGWIKLTSQGVSTAAFIAVRLTVLLLTGSLLTMTTTTLDITEAFERLLSPLARVGVPAHEFALIMGIALRFLPQFMDEFRSIRAAQLARGAKLATSPTRSGLNGLTSLIVPLFTSAFRHADTLSGAMEARCYHGAHGRTRLHPLSFTSRDAMAAGIIAALFIVVIIL